MINHQHLTDLWDSTERLLSEFNVQQSQETTLANILEELRELLLADTPERIAEEAADVMVTIIAHLIAKEYPLEDIPLDKIGVSTLSKIESGYYSVARLMNDIGYGAHNNVDGYAAAFTRLMHRTTPEAIERVITKNAGKDWVTCYVHPDTGKITRYKPDEILAGRELKAERWGGYSLGGKPITDEQHQRLMSALGK